MTGKWYPPLEGCMPQFRGSSSRNRTNLCGGPCLGEPSGGKWMVIGVTFFTGQVIFCGRIYRFSSMIPSMITNFRSLSGELGRCEIASCVFASVFKIVTWLILPVVICLSQRLSHACLSISNYTVKLRMAH